MKSDKEYLISIIEGNLPRELKLVRYGDLIKQIVDLLKQKEYDKELEIELLKELNIFVILKHISISVDPRGDSSIKSGVLCDIQKELEEGKITRGPIDELKHCVNEKCIEYFLDPLKQKKEHDDFWKENPDIIF